MMKITNFSIKKIQLEQLKARSRETGIPMSEMVRRGIDLYFKQIEKEKRNGTN